MTYFLEKVRVLFSRTASVVLFDEILTNLTTMGPRRMSLHHSNDRNWIAMSNNFSFNESCRVNVVLMKFLRNCTFQSKFKSTYRRAILKVRTDVPCVLLILVLRPPDLVKWEMINVLQCHWTVYSLTVCVWYFWPRGRAVHERLTLILLNLPYLR